MHHPVQVQLLGSFQLAYKGQLVTAIRRSSRAQMLLTYLILNRHSPCSRDRIAFLFWPDTTEKQARTNLRKLIYDMRKLVLYLDDLIRVDTDNLQWQPTLPYCIDVEGFEQALTTAATHNTNVYLKQASLQKAVELYHADLLIGCYEDWLLAERDRLHRHHIMALEELMILAEQQQDFRVAIRYGYRLLRHERLHEATYRALIRLYRLCGERALAIQIYERCECLLEEMLGVLPCAETRAEFARVL